MRDSENSKIRESICVALSLLLACFLNFWCTSYFYWATWMMDKARSIWPKKSTVLHCEVCNSSNTSRKWSFCSCNDNSVDVESLATEATAVAVVSCCWKKFESHPAISAAVINVVVFFLVGENGYPSTAAAFPVHFCSVLWHPWMVKALGPGSKGTIELSS